jgi:hypothetical protein
VVPGLQGVVLKVLTHLQSRMSPGDPNDRFRKALVEIVENVAGLNDGEQSRWDVDAPVNTWSDRDAIVERLRQRYALMLDVDVDDEDSDYLLWFGVDPSATYGSGLAPDVEHLCLAILGLEGVMTVMASANWDGLIEAAMAQITEDPAEHLGVVVLQQDLRDGSVPVQLLKFHGCAVMAGSGDSIYRKALVGRQAQITAWPNAQEKAAVRTKMLSAATEKPTFMVGFSAQDSNIQIRAGRPQTNGHVEALHKTILDECWRPAFARYLYPRLSGLRRELESYLAYYNHDRTHHGRLTRGRIPQDIIYGARKMEAR